MSRLRFSQILVFVLASITEVHVNAASFVTLPEPKDPIQVPENCLVETSVCTVRTEKHQRYVMQIGETRVTLGSDSVFVRFSADSGAVISGYVLVEAEEKFRLTTPYGEFEASGAEFLAHRESGSVNVQVLNGKVVLHPLGHEDSVRLGPGFQNWMGRVATNGKATVGIPHAYDFEDVLKELSPVFSGNRKKFETFLKEMRENWEGAVSQASLLHDSVVKREIADAEHKRQEEEAAHMRWEKERDHWRQILWKRTFE